MQQSLVCFIKTLPIPGHRDLDQAYTSETLATNDLQHRLTLRFEIGECYDYSMQNVVRHPTHYTFYTF